MIKFLFLLFLLLPNLAEAATLYISPTGTGGSNNCQTFATPCSVARVQQVWANGDTIKFLAGTYLSAGVQEGAMFLNPPSNVVFETFDTGTVLIKLRGTYADVFLRILSAASNITVRGTGNRNFIIEGRDFNGTYCWDCYFNSGFQVEGVTNLTVENIECRYMFTCMNHLSGGGPATFRNVNFHHMGWSPNPSGGLTQTCNVDYLHEEPASQPDQTECHGIYSNGTYHVINSESHHHSGYGFECILNCLNSTFVGNKIYSNNGDGILLQGSTGAQVYNNEIYSGGTAITATGTNVIYGNTIYNNNAGICFSNQSGGTGTAINNIVINNAGFQISNNCHVGTATVNLSNNVTSGNAANMFVDAANRDFRLCTAVGVPVNCPNGAAIGTGPGGITSPLNQGITLGSPWNVDIAGSTRPTGAYDIGAWEMGVTAGGKPTPILLVGRYSFDNVATDSSGRSPPNNATLTGGATYDAAGKYNQALSLNGSTAYALIPDSNDLDMTTGFSIFAWVKPVNNNLSYIVSKVNSGEGSFWLANSTGLCGGPFGGYSQGGDVNVCYGSPLIISPQTWTHLGLTYDALSPAELKFYLNSIQVTQIAGGATLSVGGGNVRIGSWDGSDFFNGLIDEVWILQGQIPATGPNDGECTTAWSTANYSVRRIMDCPINTLTPTSPVGIKVGASPAANKIGGSGIVKQGN